MVLAMSWLLIAGLVILALLVIAVPIVLATYWVRKENVNVFYGYNAENGHKTTGEDTVWLLGKGVKTPDECQELCKGQEGCKVWMHSKDTAWPERCWGADKVLEEVEQQGVTSGYKLL